MRLDYPDPFVPFAGGFLTESRKLEFVSERMAAARNSIRWPAIRRPTRRRSGTRRSPRGTRSR